MNTNNNKIDRIIERMQKIINGNNDKINKYYSNSNHNIKSRELQAELDDILNSILKFSSATFSIQCLDRLNFIIIHIEQYIYKLKYNNNNDNSIKNIVPIHFPVPNLSIRYQTILLDIQYKLLNMIINVDNEWYIFNKKLSIKLSEYFAVQDLLYNNAANEDYLKLLHHIKSKVQFDDNNFIKNVWDYIPFSIEIYNLKTFKQCDPNTNRINNMLKDKVKYL